MASSKSTKTNGTVAKGKTRWPDHEHELIHTFGVEDYDEYWNAVPMRTRMRPIHRRMFEEISKRVKAPGKLLELGPGPGHLFWSLAKDGYEMYACDISQVVLDNLKAPAERVRLANLNEGIPKFGVRFNVILSAMVLHHIFKPETFLAELHDSLETGGYLILTIPNIVVLRNRLKMMFGKFPHLSPSHRNFMTPQEVKELLRRARFTVEGFLPARRKPLQMISPKLFSKELIVIAHT